VDRPVASDHPDRARVECYSGTTYADRPTALWWEGRRFVIQSILARWRTPGEVCFRVETVEPDARRLELFYSEVEDEWRVVDVDGR